MLICYLWQQEFLRNASSQSLSSQIRKSFTAYLKKALGLPTDLRKTIDGSVAGSVKNYSQKGLQAPLVTV